jgi:hypothetical protein
MERNLLRDLKRSPDFTLLNALWGYIKNKVYLNWPPLLAIERKNPGRNEGAIQLDTFQK